MKMRKMWKLEDFNYIIPCRTNLKSHPIQLIVLKLLCNENCLKMFESVRFKSFKCALWKKVCLKEDHRGSSSVSKQKKMSKQLSKKSLKCAQKKKKGKTSFKRVSQMCPNKKKWPKNIKEVPQLSPNKKSGKEKFQRSPSSVPKQKKSVE